MKNYLYKTALLFLLVISVVSCKTTKYGGKTVKTEHAEILKTSELSTIEAIEKIQQAQPAFTRAFVRRMSVDIDFKGRQLNVGATCKMVSDSAIHISIQPFMGIELFKVEMTPEKVVVIDKTNRAYYESNYAILNQNHGLVVDFYGIQALLTNRMFIPGKKVIAHDDFIWKDKNRNTLSLYNYSINEDVGLALDLSRISQVNISTADKKAEMITSYQNFKIFDEELFPEKIMIDVIDKKSTSSFYFKIDEIVFNKDFQMSAADLSRYSQKDVQSLFKK